MTQETIEAVSENGFDQAKAEQFVGKVLSDTSGLFATLMAAIGDRYGLFKALHDAGPSTAAQLASRGGINERYAQEWLAGMTAAGYIAFDPATSAYTLPAEHVATLATEPGPTFFGGVHEELLGCLLRLENLLDAFVTGGGVSLERLPTEVFDGIDRFTANWHENLLLQQWLPSIPGVLDALAAGVDVADVGCGQGRALVKLALAYPNSRFVGFDVLPLNIERARAHAAEAGVADRIRFVDLDVSRGIPGVFDLVTAWDVIHDAVDPVGVLTSIRQSLRPGGRFLCLDINCSDRPEDNVGPVATLMYGFSIALCMTSSLAHGGAGLGTMGLPESKLRKLALEAGFSGIERVAMDNPFNSLYVVSR